MLVQMGLSGASPSALIVLHAQLQDDQDGLAVTDGDGLLLVQRFKFSDLADW